MAFLHQFTHFRLEIVSFFLLPPCKPLAVALHCLPNRVGRIARIGFTGPFVDQLIFASDHLSQRLNPILRFLPALFLLESSSVIVSDFDQLAQFDSQGAGNC
jgi:hypothetical protein